ncbi:MAG TPA: hypothetical protein VFN35_36320 [Ktedonobacteraceae bacterium]|nr:hypothetical protein [Ktedonobacteraceae bacterium]
MLKKTIIYGLVGALCGAFLGILIPAIFGGRGTDLLLGTGIGLVSGLVLSMFLSWIPLDMLDDMARAAEFFAGIIEGCCSFHIIGFLGFLTFLTTFLLCQQIWLSAIISISTIGLLLPGVSLFAWTEHKKKHYALPEMRPGSLLRGKSIAN